MLFSPPRVAQDVARTAGARLLCKPGRVEAVLLLAMLRHIVRSRLLRCLRPLPGRIRATPYISVCTMDCRACCGRRFIQPLLLGSCLMHSTRILVSSTRNGLRL